MSRIAGFTVALMLVASVAGAQEWRGTGRLMGKVQDEQGKPIEGVVVSASLPAFHGVLAQGKTDKKGEWTIDDIGEGNWELTFEADMYVSAKASVDVDENGRSSGVRTTLKKKFDPNAYVQEQGKKVNALMDAQKYAEARAVCEDIAAKVPAMAIRVQPVIARAYLLEGNSAKASEVVKATLAKEPANVEAKLVLIDALLKDGAIDEAVKVLNGMEESKVPDITPYVNIGVALNNKQKPAEALPYFEKAIAKFPQVPEPYYYHAMALVPMVNEKKDPKDPERAAMIEKIKADLNKYLQLAPNSAGADGAKKLLEQINKQTETK